MGDGMFNELIVYMRTTFHDHTLGAFIHIRIVIDSSRRLDIDSNHVFSSDRSTVGQNVSHGFHLH